MAHPVDVICVGSVIADLFCDPISQLPAAGSLQLLDDILLAGGGSAVNIAVSLSRLGLCPGVVGKTGNDLLGKFVRAYLVERNVNVDSLGVSETTATATTIIINISGEDRRYLHCAGANRELSIRDVPMDRLKDAHVLYLGSYLSLAQFTQSEIGDLFARAKTFDLLTVLDVVIPHGRPCSLADFEYLLPVTDVFLPNTDEARCLTGLSDPIEQARRLAGFNPNGTVVVTCGSAGAVAVGPEGLRCIGRYPIPLCDPSGSGDAFTAGFILASLEGWPLETKLRFAGVMGGSAVASKSCTSSVFNRVQALEYISTHEPQPFLWREQTWKT